MAVAVAATAAGEDDMGADADVGAKEARLDFVLPSAPSTPASATTDSSNGDLGVEEVAAASVGAWRGRFRLVVVSVGGMMELLFVTLAGLSVLWY